MIDASVCLKSVSVFAVMKTFVATYFLLPTGILGTTVILIEYKLVFISHPSQVLAFSIIEQPGSTLVISRVTF